MLDRILIKDKHNAVMIFTDRDPFYLYSSNNVCEIIEIMLMPSHVCHYTPFVDTTKEDTMSINIPVAA